VLTIVENLWAVGAPPAGGAQRFPDPHSCWGGVYCPPPRILPPLSAFGFDFRPFRPHSAVPQQSTFPFQCLGVVWIKHCTSQSPADCDVHCDVASGRATTINQL